MPDAKISTLTAITTPAATTELPVNDAGTSKKINLGQVRAWLGRTINNASTAAQGPGFVSDTYLSGSLCAVPSATALIAGSMYRCKWHMTKTNAGTGAPIIIVRFGTAGTNADPALATFTLTAGTAAADNGFFEIFTTFRTIGASNGVAVTALTLVHEGGTTGLTAQANVAKITTTATALSTNVTGLTIGTSLAAGTSAAWTANLVQAELYNLAA